MQDVFNTSSRPLQDVLEDVKLLCWRRLEDVFKTKKCLRGEYFKIDFDLLVFEHGLFISFIFKEHDMKLDSPPDVLKCMGDKDQFSLLLHFGKFLILSKSQEQLLVLLNSDLVYCENWNPTLEVPWSRIVSAIWHYYVLNVFISKG